MMNIQHDTRQVEVLRPRESEPEREVGWRPGGTGIAPPAPDFHFFHRIQRAKALTAGHVGCV